MKKSQLKQLIREVIKESAMGNLHLEITESIEGLIELGATYEYIRTVIDQLEEESKQEPKSYDKSEKPSTSGSFDVG